MWSGFRMSDRIQLLFFLLCWLKKFWLCFSLACCRACYLPFVILSPSVLRAGPVDCFSTWLILIGERRKKIMPGLHYLGCLSWSQSVAGTGLHKRGWVLITRLFYRSVITCCFDLLQGLFIRFLFSKHYPKTKTSMVQNGSALFNSLCLFAWWLHLLILEEFLVALESTHRIPNIFCGSSICGNWIVCSPLFLYASVRACILLDYFIYMYIYIDR